MDRRPWLSRRFRTAVRRRIRTCASDAANAIHVRTLSPAGPVRARAKSRRCQPFSPMWMLVGRNSEWTQPNGSSVAPWTRLSAAAEIFPSAVSMSSQSVQRIGFPQPLKVIQGSSGRGREALAVEKGQTARRAGDMEHHGGGDAVEVVCVPLENGCGAVGERDAFDAGHAPDANRCAFGKGLAGEGAQVLEQGGGRALVPWGVSRDWWDPGRAGSRAARPGAVRGRPIRLRSRGGRRPARSSPP